MVSAVSNLRSAGNGNSRFNAEALSWDSRPLVHEASKHACTAILQKYSDLQLPTSQLKVLEIGCGTGILSFMLALHVREIVAIDAAEGMVHVLSKKLRAEGAPGNVRPVCVLLQDPEDRALPPAEEGEVEGQRMKFDLITSHLVLHHIPDLKTVLRTMYGCLAIEGRVMLTDFEDFGPEAKRFHAQSRMGGVERHGIARKDMATLLEEAGFRDVQVKVAFKVTKIVEKFEGEFGVHGAPYEDGQGEKMDFPFVFCYGLKR